MRPVVLGLLSVVGIAVASVSGCEQIIGLGDPKLGPQGTVGGAGGAIAAGGEGGAGGEAPPPPCHPDDPICNLVDSECLALVDNAGRDSGALRVQQITIFKPTAFASGLEYQAITQNLMINLEECNLFGGGTINFLVEMDAVNNTATIGGAYPVEDPTEGYTFVDDLFPVEGGMLQVSPATVPAQIEGDGLVVGDAVEFITLPLFLDPQATQVLLFPLRQVELSDTVLSSDFNCIGSHNAAELSPDNGCLPDLENNIKPFVDGGQIDGYMLLEEADDVIVSAFGLNRSLCVIFAQDLAEFGDGGSPTRCAYKDGQIKFPGDWCSTTNSGATVNCHDAVKFSFSFAASAVKLNE